MQKMVEFDLGDLRFRASREFQLVQTGRLPARLKVRRPSRNAYGFFVPRSGSDRWNDTLEASSDAALLFLTLRRPGRLPTYLGDHNHVSQERWFRDLLARGVLEVRIAGQFITGLAALRELKAPSGFSTAMQNPLAELSDAGIRYGYRYCCLNPGGQEENALVDEVAMRLYQFNTVPAPAGLRSLLLSSDGVGRYLGAEEPVMSKPSVRGWIWKPPDAGDWWRYWVPTNGRTTATWLNHIQDRKGKTDAKLYISPTLLDTPRAVEIILPIISESSASAMKVGNYLGGLTRPDKMVAYFSDCRDLVDTSSKIAAAMGRLTAQGVPFTSNLTANGLLSWASDEFSDDAVNLDTSSSWRVFVTRSLARGLVESYGQGHSIDDAVVFAKTAAEVAGIDTVNWLPSGLAPSLLADTLCV